MTPSTFRGVLGYRVFLRASRVPQLDLNAPQVVLFEMERDPETGLMSTRSVKQHYAIKDGTRWPDSDGSYQKGVS